MVTLLSGLDTISDINQSWFLRPRQCRCCNNNTDTMGLVYVSHYRAYTKRPLTSYYIKYPMNNTCKKSAYA
ncbi:hypothetical protein DDB_G0294318 [Dictyostelium discoideum AX4]|uniref:hypothetical protein n=1 Tax=Dictyostelium discoideum AX4 TaxID=352472 RepID=UPI00004E44E3|nr:hypothetical protein DDB_G0294318 [Dictyostelium discoideum AX4]EAL60324.1 hypothetical protein DDB_G0294318 [Dictyostelium discoideum AX4]|eukprot:XP_628737.1 hypothetical protein DDB_G0294318 [Dictyostelium discoideum AX4]